MKQRPDDICYVNANIIDRLDGQSAPFWDQQSAKRIVVVDPGKPPEFLQEVKLDHYMVAGERYVISMSSFEDPEGNDVIFRIVLRKAALFAYFNYRQGTIVIEEGATNLKDHAGYYNITLELVEVVNGAQMPPK